MQISILQGLPTGTSVYVESHTPTTNVNGVVSIEIGGGTVVSGTFAGIDWGNGPYYLKTETDPTGGTTYTIAGTNQLLSVPYALHAKTADSFIGTNPSSLKYPQGIDGEYVAITNNYTVPVGKTLYIISQNNNGIEVSGNVFGSVGFAVFPGSTILSITSGFVTGVLVNSDPSISIIVHSGSSYTVPIGKILVLKSNGNIAGAPGEYMYYNGNQLYQNGEVLGVFPSGANFTFDASNIGFTGYLLDE